MDLTEQVSHTVQTVKDYISLPENAGHHGMADGGRLQGADDEDA